MIRAGIYIHIPFCTVRCMYCDFYTTTYEKNSIPKFVNAIVLEIEQCEVDVSNWIIDTIFFGGGTPSLLDSKSIETIIKALQKKYNLSNIQECTIESNPGQLTANGLKAIRDLGINRISIGVQSLEPDLLKFLTRNHSVNDVYKTYKLVRKAGFDNVNIDMLYSIPGQTPEMLKRDLKSIIALEPEHISAYALTVEKGTELHHLVHNLNVIIPQDPDGTTWLSFTSDFLSDNGFHPYEISSFTQPGQECLHNLHYWRMEPYLAFGPSSNGFDGHRRWRNIRPIEDYLGKIRNGESPIVFTEELNYKEILNEKVGFGIRLTEGVDLNKIRQPELSCLMQNIESAKQKWPGCFAQGNGTLKLSKKGILFADALAVDLLIT